MQISDAIHLPFTYATTTFYVKCYKKLDLKKFCLYSFNKLIRCVSCSAFGERQRKNSSNVIREVYK